MGMQSLKKRAAAMIGAVVVAAMAFTIVAVSAAGSEQQSPLPVESFEATLEHGLSRNSSAGRTDLMSGWQTVYTATFESGFPAEWTVLDNNPAGGLYTWGLITGTNTTPGGNHSAWAAGQALTGTLPLVPTGAYTNSMDAWMVAGPFDLSQASDAELQFNVSLASELNADFFGWAASTDGTTFHGGQVSGGTASWMGFSFDMQAYSGRPAVWIAFRFVSDDNGIVGQGPFVDDIKFNLMGPFQNFLPLLVNQFPPPPGWEDHFDNASTGWPNDSGAIYDETTWQEVSRWWRGYNTVDGHYRIRVDIGPAPWVWFYQPDALASYRPPTDKYCIETRIWVNVPAFWGNAGLIFGANEANTDLYAACLGVGNDQFGNDFLGWFLVRNPVYQFPKKGVCGYQAGKIAEGTEGTSYYGWNRIQVGVDGDVVDLWVGGVYIGRYTMPGLASTTRIGLTAGDYEVSPFEARFDYVKVTPNAACTP